MTPYHESDYHDAMLWAFNLAADFIDQAEYGGAETRAEEIWRQGGPGVIWPERRPDSNPGRHD